MGPGRALIEPPERAEGIVWTTAGERTRFPKAYRDRALDTWIGGGRGFLALHAQPRETALFVCVDALCADVDPLRSGAGVEYDSPQTQITLRDGVAWVNTPGQWPPLLPNLGAFYPEDQPRSLRETLGPDWEKHDIGLVLVEMASRSAHHRIVLRQRVGADLAAADTWRCGTAHAPAPFFFP